MTAKAQIQRLGRSLLLVWAVAPTFVLTGVWLGLLWLWLSGSGDQAAWAALLILLGAFSLYGLVVFAAEIWLLVRFSAGQQALVRWLRRPNLALSALSAAAAALAVVRLG